MSALALVAGAGLAATAAAAGPTAVHAAPAAKHVGSRHVGSMISLRQTSRGTVLVGANGHSLYLFTSDTTNHSHCGPGCRKKWPPVTATHLPKAGAGVSRRHLKLIKGHQVSYYGRPLYTYYKDTKAGQTKGEGLLRFGGYWYLVGAKGGIV
ncbi:MAG TPA: hypothetical protein VME70_14925 [Mycobacteriales bacterium]|nr:hypothetical protein [Mycobacteriales bacterium]